MEGRFTLYQSIMSSIPIYGVSLFRFSGVVSKIEKLMGDFFVGE